MFVKHIHRLRRVIVAMEVNGVPCSTMAARRDLESIVAKSTREICHSPLFVSKVEKYNPKNRTHVSYVVNTWLQLNNYGDMVLPEWSPEDIEKVASLTSGDLLTAIVGKSVKHAEIVSKAMEQLCADRTAARIKAKGAISEAKKLLARYGYDPKNLEGIKEKLIESLRDSEDEK